MFCFIYFGVILGFFFFKEGVILEIFLECRMYLVILSSSFEGVILDFCFPPSFFFFF